MENVNFLLILAPPLLSFLIIFLGGRTLGDKMSSWIASSAVFISFLNTVYLAFVVFGKGASVAHLRLGEWFSVGPTAVTFAFTFDKLSALFCLVITGIGFLIHIYSIGYMKHEKNTFRFFSYLSLFIFFMLILVLAENLVLLFIGWEGVGLCSYLLIGYYGNKLSANKASQKAFLVNRIGDYGLIMAIIGATYMFSSLSMGEINKSVAGLLSSGQISNFDLTLFLGLLFLACTGKSAQFPLYTWILDAMEAPTPVSALIHAATMVTAGLYLIARLHPVFMLAPDVLGVIAFVGAFTAIAASFVAMAQNDIKRVLAFSTISQLGFMFLAMGVGAFEAGIFHMFTHAFFKALLFLGAGSVITAMHHEQDITKMGGLSNSMPHTTRCFAIGTYAISSLPLASGFFSKDEILWATFNSVYGSTVLWAVALITASMTSFYMYRLFFKVFIIPGSHAETPSESPRSMVAPLYIFAFFAIFAGLLAVPQYLNPFFSGNLFHAYFYGFFPALQLTSGADTALSNYTLLIMGTFMAAAGYFFARTAYLGDGKPLIKPNSFLVTLAQRKLFYDEICHLLVIKPLNWIGGRGLKETAEYLVELTEEIIGGFLSSISTGVKKMQNGQTSWYALLTIGGIVFMLTLV